MPLQHAKLEDNKSEMVPVGQNLFMVAAITALYSSSFSQGFSNSQCQAAIQALLRHGAHEDGAHYHAKTPGGLHPAYAAFNLIDRTENKVLSRMDLIEASLGDVFDVITLQDCLDSGISLLIRCPGSEPPSNLAAEKITLDIYVTPCKLVRNERVSGDTAMLVQAFSQEFVLPHLQCFAEQCKIESVKAPKPRLLAEPIDLNRQNHLPTFLSPVASRIQCTACSAEAKPDPVVDVQHLSASAAIRESAVFTPSAKKMHPPSTPSTARQRTARQRRPADAFLFVDNKKFPEPIPLVIPDSAPSSPLISLGPHTDAILDRFSFGDNVLPCLHILVGTVRSSRWEAILRGTPWNLTYEQASNLSSALLADLKGTPGLPVTTKSKFSILSMLVKVLGVVTLLCPEYMLSSVPHSRPLNIAVFAAPKPGAQCVQPKVCSHVKVVLSMEARAALRLNQHEKSQRFQKDLNDAWRSFEKVTKTLASKHHKSVHHVENEFYLGHTKFRSRRDKINAWNAFCWKQRCNDRMAMASSRNVLPELVQENRANYHGLSVEEKECLVEEFSQFRELKAVGIRLTSKSKINDVTHTLNAVENEEQQRTIKIAFLLSVRLFVALSTANFRRSPKIQMRECKGWPEAIPFANLSSASSSLSQLELLLQKWEMGMTYWKEISDEEVEELWQKRNEQIEGGEIKEPSRCTRSDKGKKCVRHSSDNPPSRKKYKSAATIVNSDDEGGEEPEESSLPPAPPSTQGQVDGDANLTATAASASASPGNPTTNAGTSPGNLTATAASAGASPGNPTASAGTSPGNPTATAASASASPGNPTTNAGTSPGNPTTTATSTGASPGNLTTSAGTSPAEQTATTKNTSTATTANPAMMDSTLDSDIHGILSFGGTKQQVFDDLVESILNFDGASIGLY
ncbi:hypothetical protein SCLCIDRAFT_28011 [Scleroderma citrinum Foug A]|uniref:Uncharacterized protein n=1 Tax=Scleroderma citrinum Foug A TaxID=1036808 RepID=A0A0C3DR35_9AGAM|nr:hypothetical protein SCLCIDRAFT_28011 [Scleroderma citrinum Foug A]